MPYWKNFQIFIVFQQLFIVEYQKLWKYQDTTVALLYFAMKGE